MGFEVVDDRAYGPHVAIIGSERRGLEPELAAACKQRVGRLRFALLGVWVGRLCSALFCIRIGRLRSTPPGVVAAISLPKPRRGAGVAICKVRPSRRYTLW